MSKRICAALVTLVVLAVCMTSGVLAVEQVPIEARVKPILTVDGLQFKDLNANGVLDPYEDWRLPTEERVNDLLSKMTLEEKVALLFHCMSAGQFAPAYPVTDEFLYREDCPFPADIMNGRYTTGYSMWYYINEYGITHFLDDQAGTPAELCDYHNKVQEIAEATRLGIPVTFSTNREYNAWGSMVDMPHTAFGYANDPDLCARLWSIYGQEMAAVGYHVTLNPYGVELNGWYGEDPNYVAELTALEVRNMQAGGIETCVKHFIARGGMSFAACRSIGQVYQNWMVPWKAAVDAGTGWIMTNTGTGLTNTVRVDYDRETMSYLRDVLGYDGVVLTDWGPVGGGTRGVTGITVDGIDLSKLSLREKYTMMLENGVDQFGAVSVQPGEDTSAPRDISNWPDAIVNAVKDGTCPEELVDRSATRILRSKFNLGLFDDPYVDINEALELCASPEFIANPWPIVDNATLNAARNPRVVALERELQAKSTVLIKNDDDLLPLKDGTKVYVYSTSDADEASDAIGEYGLVVDSLDEADVAVVRAGTIRISRSESRVDDSAMAAVEQAKMAGKPVALVLESTNPDVQTLAGADAILLLTFTRPPDHGETLAGFIHSTEPSVLADMLFGRREPQGMLVKEIARSQEQTAAQWNDLSFDTGASDEVRLWLMQMVKTDPHAQLPINLGDPLFTYGYGMRYGIGAEFTYNTLVAPAIVKTGEVFTISCVIMNNGGAGYTNVKAYVGDELLGEKFMALNGGQYRVVQIDCVLDDVGEHLIKLGPLTTTVTVTE